jgi:hypothetical protein
LRCCFGSRGPRRVMRGSARDSISLPTRPLLAAARRSDDSAGRAATAGVALLIFRAFGVARHSQKKIGQSVGTFFLVDFDNLLQQPGKASRSHLQALRGASEDLLAVALVSVVLPCLWACARGVRTPVKISKYLPLFSQLSGYRVCGIPDLPSF